MRQPLLIDGHVHVHACYDEAAFLSSALRRLRGYGEGFPTLMLAEIAGTNVFARWRDGGGPWQASTTAESSSLVLDGRLLVIAGRQIVTSEGVELLAQCSSEGFADGLPLNETIASVLAAGGLAVLPWGVGKWLGRRGALVAEARTRFPVLLGDNAGRPTLWPRPALFRDRLVLLGTDPLALPSQQGVAGSYGFALSTAMDPQFPARSLRNALVNGAIVTPLGRRVGILGFLRQQLGLRLAR
jgi:hypothetical protein